MKRKFKGVYRVNRKTALRLFFAVVLLAVLIAFIAWRNSPPVRHARGLYVSDFANMLSWRQRNFILRTSNRALEETGVDIAVLTVRNIRHRDIVTIEEFAWQNAIGWGLGGPDNSMFALLVYNRADSRVYIAAGNIFADTPLAPERAHAFLEDNMRPFYEGSRRMRGNAIFEGYRAMVLQVYAHMGITPSGDMMEFLIPGAPLRNFAPLWFGTAIVTLFAFYRFVIRKKHRKSRRGHGTATRRSYKQRTGNIEVDVIRWEPNFDDEHGPSSEIEAEPP